MHGRGLGKHGQPGTRFVRGISHLDMIRFMPGHHLVSRDALKHRVHDGPFGRRETKAFLRFHLRQSDHFGEASVKAKLGSL